MIDRELALLWAGEPHLPQRALRWSWARAAGALVLRRGLRGLSLDGHIDTGAAARGFFSWARDIEPDLPLRAADPIDHSHFAAGVLLRCLLVAQPAHCRALPRAAAGTAADALTDAWRAWPEAALLTRLALTLLDAWRQSDGAPPLALDERTLTPPHIASYFENLREDVALAGAFLDLFTGVEPEWRHPTLAHERPAMRRALARRHAAA